MDNCVYKFAIIDITKDITLPDVAPLYIDDTSDVLVSIYTKSSLYGNVCYKDEYDKNLLDKDNLPKYILTRIQLTDTVISIEKTGSMIVRELISDKKCCYLF